MNATHYQLARTKEIVSGADARSQLLHGLEQSDSERVAFITSPSVAKLEQYAELKALIGKRLVLERSDVKPHPPANDVLAFSRQAKDQDVDSFVAVGGGSTVDTAKLAALAAGEDVNSVDELIDFGVHFEYPDTEWVRPLTSRPAPVFAVPTTLSAAEWDGFAGTVDERTGTKHVARYVELTPEVVYLDPALAATTPRGLWATTGVRALDHAIETAYAINATPFTTALSYGALELLSNNLPRSVQDASDYDAALACQWAGFMSITGVHNVSLGLSHAIGHQLGGFGVPHGVTSCTTLPHVMRLLLPATEPQQERIAVALGSTAGAGGAADAVADFLDRLGVPRHLRDTGLSRESFEAIARATMGDIVARESPVPVTEEIVLGLLEEAW